MRRKALVVAILAMVFSLMAISLAILLRVELREMSDKNIQMVMKSNDPVTNAANINFAEGEFSSIDLLVTGDSITDAAGTSPKKWPDFLGEWLNCTVKNDGKTDTGLIRANGSTPGILARIDTWDNTYGNIDAILVMGNMNDGGLGPDVFPVGDFSDSASTESQYGALHATVQKLLSKYPNKPIGWIISTPRLANTTYPPPHNEKAWGKDGWFEPYCQAIIDVLEHYSIPYLDLYHTSGLRPWLSDNNTMYFNKSDGVHPNELGHELIAYKIYAFTCGFMHGTQSASK